VRRLAPTLAIGLAVALLPARADAHLVTTGLGPVYDGIGHLLASPEDLVPAIALALYAGLRGAPSGRRALLLLPLAWLAGGLVGLRAPVTIALPIGAIAFLVLGVLVATDLALPVRAVAALTVALGLALGFENGAALAAAGAGARNLIGIAAALFVVVALVAAFVVALRRPWKRIAVRVAGSWIAAIGLLLVGWSLRGAR
jgi:urease accessory protein